MAKDETSTAIMTGWNDLDPSVQTPLPSNAPPERVWVSFRMDASNGQATDIRRYASEPKAAQQALRHDSPHHYGYAACWPDDPREPIEVVRTGEVPY